jgi:small conductance mechanosensitive channel
LFILVLALTVSAGLSAQENPESDEAAKEIDYTMMRELTADHSVEELQLLVTPLTVEQLDSEAERWQEMIQQEMFRIANLKVAAMSAEDADADRLHEAINEATSKRAELIKKAEMIVDSMEIKGADPAVIDKYRGFITGALASELQATDLKTILSQVVDWAFSQEGGVGFLKDMLVVIITFAAVFVFARVLAWLLMLGIRRVSSMSRLLQDFLAKAIFWLILLFGILFSLSIAGFSITPLFAVVGGASFILAFAMQETLGNLAAGMMIMINKPFDVGDFVSTNSVSGKVEAVSIVSTTIRTVDNQVVILPNSTVWSSVITNVTVSPTRRVDMVFGIGYGDDIEKAMEVLQKTVADHPQVLDEPEPNIQVHELADSSVNLICRPWARTEDYWSVYWDLNRQVKAGFDAAGITIPFPQRDVHLVKES